MIPAFGPSGLLPPFVGADAAERKGVSPYASDALEVVQRFGYTAPRVHLLRGFFDWRAALVAAGVTGIQWINGSFCEDCEATRARPPGDIDVVNFIERPAAVAQMPAWGMFVQANHALFHPLAVKATHGCDAYAVDVAVGAGNLLSQATYWFGLFTHTRVTHEWKGMVWLPLPSNDAAAIAHLNAIGGAAP